VTDQLAALVGVHKGQLTDRQLWCAGHLPGPASPHPLGRLTKAELIQLLDNLKEELSAE
jgi:phage FluMu protein gp41